MAELDLAFEAIRGSDRVHFVGQRDLKVVAAAEEALGLVFPPTYRRFVSELGAGSVGGREFYGVIDADFTNSTAPNGIWLTLDERTTYALPSQFVIVGDTGMGEWYALDTQEKDANGESPVLILWPDGWQTVEVTAADFGSFFWDSVKRVFGPRYD
jgi:hypothetical protein